MEAVPVDFLNPLFRTHFQTDVPTQVNGESGASQARRYFKPITEAALSRPLSPAEHRAVLEAEWKESREKIEKLRAQHKDRMAQERRWS